MHLLQLQFSLQSIRESMKISRTRGQRVNTMPIMYYNVMYDVRIGFIIHNSCKNPNWAKYYNVQV